MEEEGDSEKGSESVVGEEELASGEEEKEEEDYETDSLEIANESGNVNDTSL